MTAHVDFRKLGFTRAVKARDLWAGKDLGTLEVGHDLLVPGHGVVFLKVSK